MRLYFILAFICKTVMVWPGANNQFDYNTTRYTKVLFGWIKHSYCFNYPVMSILQYSKYKQEKYIQIDYIS